MTQTNHQDEPPFAIDDAHNGQEVLRALLYLGFTKQEIADQGTLSAIKDFQVDNKAIDTERMRLPHARQAIELVEQARKLFGERDFDLAHELEEFNRHSQTTAIVRYEQDIVHQVLVGAARALRLDKRDATNLTMALDPILYLHKPQTDSCSMEQAIAFDQQQLDMVRRVLRAQKIEEGHANTVYLLLVLRRLQTQPESYELYKSLLSAPYQSQSTDNRSVEVLRNYVSALANPDAPERIDQVWNKVAAPLYEHEFSEVEHRSHLLLQLATFSCLQKMPPLELLHAYADGALAERRLAERTAQYNDLRGKVDAVGGERVLDGMRQEKQNPAPRLPPTPEQFGTIAATQMRQLQATLQILQKQMHNLSPEMQHALQNQMQNLQEQLRSHQPGSWQSRTQGTSDAEPLAPGGL